MPKLQPTGRGVSQTKCGQAAARRVERMACAILRDKRGWQSIRQSIVCDSKNLGMKIMEDTGKARLIHEDIWIHTRETDTILGTIGLQ